MTAPLVTVVIPCFNYEHFVADAVRSALEQDWPALEVIAVDDGSTDGTPEVLAGFGDAIRVIRRENGGLNAATDTGVAAAGGEFITFLDADDTWAQGRIRALAEPLLAHPEAGISYGDMTVVDVDGKVVHESFNVHKGLVPPPSGRFLGRMLSFNCVSAGSLMVRASLRDRFHPIPPVAAWNDWWIATQVLREADIIAVPESVNIYRQHATNMNLGADEARAVSLLRAELPFRRWLLTHTAPPLVTVADLLQGLATLDWAIARVTQFDGQPPQALLNGDVASAGLALDDARAALSAGDAVQGLAGLVAAVAHAPRWADPRELMGEAVGALRQDPGQRPVTPANVELVAVDAVLVDPSLLARWAGAHSGDDSTILVIGGVGDDGRRDALVALVARLGLDGDDSADLLAVPERDPATVALRLGRPVTGVLAAADPRAAAHETAVRMTG